MFPNHSSGSCERIPLNDDGLVLLEDYGELCAFVMVVALIMLWVAAPTSIKLHKVKMRGKTLFNIDLQIRNGLRAQVTRNKRHEVMDVEVAVLNKGYLSKTVRVFEAGKVRTHQRGTSQGRDAEL